MKSIAQAITESSHERDVLFSTLDHHHVSSQRTLDKNKARHCNFNIIVDKPVEYRDSMQVFFVSFAEFQKTTDST